MNREERILKYINTADEFVFSGKRYYENDFYNDVEDLVKENQELKRKLNESIHKATEFGSEVYELKKQLEEWNHHLKCSKEMLDIQGHNGNYNYDSYMLGIYNGMEYIIALFETREPIFKSGKDIEFISESQQENKQLKDKWNKLNKKYENAVADYEKTMFEKEQLNSLVNSCQEEIRQLKKQLEELKSTNKVISEELTKDRILNQDCLTTCCGIPIGDIPKLINQQKEFIEYINHYETIRGYYEYEEDGYDEYNYEDDLKQELLEILGGKE